MFVNYVISQINFIMMKLDNFIDTKMYIAIREDFPDYMTPTLVAHAVLRHHLSMTDNAINPCLLYNNWLKNSFKKCVLRVNKKEYNKIKNLYITDNIVALETWENTILNGEGSCLTIVVDCDKVPNVLKYAKLWKPKEN